MRFYIGLLFGLFLSCTGAFGQSVFDMPILFPQHKRYLSQFVGGVQQGNMMQAEKAVRSALKIFPKDANWNYNLACVMARTGQYDAAFKALDMAVDSGFIDTVQMQNDADLASLRKQKGFAPILEKAKTLAANPPKNPTLSHAFPSVVMMGQTATVDELNTMWNWDPVQGGYFTTRFDLLPASQKATYTGPYADLIAPWIAEGTASGNDGWLYVNRDEDRTQIRYETFAGVTPVLYGEAAVKKGAHLGAANGLFARTMGSHPTVGNSLLAMNRPPFWRSVPRLMTMDSQQFVVATRLSMANQLYIYDATLDMSARIQGDLLVTNNPAYLISGDVMNPAQPDAKGAQEKLTELVFAILAAMHPETKAEMLRKNLLVPTVQMLLRSHQKSVTDYFTPEAHPVVFDPSRIDGEAVIRAAHALRSETLPPFFQLAMRQESMPRQYIDFFDNVRGEGMGDSPTCVTRIWRGPYYTRKATLEAKMSTEPVTYRWFVVNGHADKIRFTPLTSDNALMTIEIDWQGALTNNINVSTRRVDIACVAVKKNGTVSAPAFYSVRWLGNEQRVYARDTKRLLSINYAPDEKGLRYEDPLLTAQKAWQDLFLYDKDGNFTGWYRKRPNGTIETFDTRGRRVLDTHPNGLSKTVTAVSYLPRLNEKGDSVNAPAIELLQSDAGEPISINP